MRVVSLWVVLRHRLLLALAVSLLVLLLLRLLTVLLRWLLLSLRLALLELKLRALLSSVGWRLSRSDHTNTTVSSTATACVLRSVGTGGDLALRDVTSSGAGRSSAAKIHGVLVV